MGRTAEIAGEYLSKGRPVLIEGRLQLDQWEDKETGQKRSKLKVVGESLQLLGSRNEGGGSGGGSGAGGGGQSSGAASPVRVVPQHPVLDEPVTAVDRQPLPRQVSQPSYDDYNSGGRTPDQSFYDDLPPPVMMSRSEYWKLTVRIPCDQLAPVSLS